jgi:MFS family permease
MFSGYGKNFWVMSLAMLMFMISFNLIIPELNTFITVLNGAEYKGLIISLFTLSAGISRPFSGKLSDTIGRKKVMLIGMGVTLIVSLLYPISIGIGVFLLLRFLHGFSAGFLPTGATALITDIIPADRRGQAMGIWGTFISLGIGIGQSLGSVIANEFGLNSLFMFAAGFAAISGILISFVRETLHVRYKFQPRLLAVGWKDVFEPTVTPSAMVMFLTAPASGIIFVLTPDMSSFLGIDNKGWFFGIYVISTIVIRLLTGRLSDKIGRRKTLLIGTSFLVTSMMMIGLSNDITSYTIASVVFGIATGISSPTLFAWTADLSPEKRRGVGAGTMFIALEFGIMAGSMSTLLTYDNTPETIFRAFSVGVGLALTAIIYLIWHLNRRNSLT